MDQATKEALEAQRQEILQRRAQFFADHPELDTWMKTKKIIYRFMAGYLIVHSILSIIAMALTQNLTGMALTSEIVKCLFGLFWLLLFLNPTGTVSWRLHIMLYVSAVYNLVLLLNNSDILRETILMLPQMPLGYMLLYGSLLVMETLFPFLLLVIATYLIAFPKHREWSEQVEAMLKSPMQGTEK